MKRIPVTLGVTLMLAAALRCACAETAATEVTAAAIDLTELIGAAATFLLALVTRRLLPWLKSKAKKEQLQLLEAGIDTAVYAAQQLFKTSAIDDRLEFALSWLRERGYEVDRTQVEARVWKMDHADNAGIELAEGILHSEDAITND